MARDLFDPLTNARAAVARFRFPTKEADVPETRNPYDRRDADRRRAAHDFAFAESPGMMTGTARFEVPPALAIEDLEALAASAHTRGEIAATDRLERHRHQQEVAAMRQAWDEGHHAGVVAGRDALLKTIAEQFERRVAEMRSELIAAFEALDPSEAWKQKDKHAAIVVIRDARDLLAELVHAHHADFAPDRS